MGAFFDTVYVGYHFLCVSHTLYHLALILKILSVELKIQPELQSRLGWFYRGCCRQKTYLKQG